jgi:chaperone BCS1
MFHATTACVLMHYLLETEVLDARSFFTLTAEYSRRAAARALARRVAGRGIGGPFRARNKPGGDSSDDDDEAARAKARGMLDALPGPGTYAFSAQGVTSWRLTVEVASPPLVLPEAYSSADMARKVDVTLRLRAASACAARDAVDALYAAAAAHAEALRGDPSRTITVKVLSSSDHDSTVVLAKRSLDTIYLPAAIKTKARDEVAAFMASKKDYERFGIPYRRTFLLAGPPGLGKTSLIHALASEFSRDVYMISVGPKTTDESLRSALSEVRGRRGTFIVLEDVDALFTLEREIDKDRAVHALSFSGLLNALDGLGAPPGVLLFLTTNYIDRLDPALLRPGRVDTVLQFEPPSAAQVAEMVATLLPTLPAERREALLARMRATPQCRGVSTAVLQKWLFDSRGCAEGPDVAVLVSLCDFYAERAAAAHRSAPSSVFA